MDIKDLRASLDFGNTYADAARMLCRDEDEVRQKAKARTGRATKKMVTEAGGAHGERHWLTPAAA